MRDRVPVRRLIVRIKTLSSKNLNEEAEGGEGFWKPYDRDMAVYTAFGRLIPLDLKWQLIGLATESIRVYLV